MKINEKILERIIAAINKTAPDSEIYLYGSRARGDYKKLSDWDLLILLNSEKIPFSIETKLIDDLFEVGWDGMILQIKEKFGGLRFYIGCGTQEMFDLIEDAEDKSITICEECGRPGTLRNGGWLVTRCDDCNNKLQGE